MAEFCAAGMREPDNPAVVVRGMEYCLFRGGELDSAPVPEGNAGIVTCGAVDSIDIAPAGGGQSYGLVFRGYLSAPRTGMYVFATLSAEGSVLYIGDKKVVDNDGRHSLGTRAGEIGLGAGLHALSVTYLSVTEPPFLTVFVAQPGEPALPIPSSVYYRDAEPALELLTPDGGEIFPVGSIMEIRWRADTTRVKAVVLELSNNGGRTWEEILPGAIGPSDSSWLKLSWVVPDSFPDGRSLLSQYCMLRVREYERGLTDVSARVFAIVRPVGAAPYEQLPLTGQYHSSWRVYDLRGRFLKSASDGMVPASSCPCRPGVVVLTAPNGTVTRSAAVVPPSKTLRRR